MNAAEPDRHFPYQRRSISKPVWPAILCLRSRLRGKSLIKTMNQPAQANVHKASVPRSSASRLTRWKSKGTRCALSSGWENCRRLWTSMSKPYLRNLRRTEAPEGCDRKVTARDAAQLAVDSSCIPGSLCSGGFVTGCWSSRFGAAFRHASKDRPVAAQRVMGRVAVSPTKLSGVSAKTSTVATPQMSGPVRLRNVTSSKKPPYGICSPARLLQVAQPVRVMAQSIPKVNPRAPISTALVREKMEGGSVRRSQKLVNIVSFQHSQTVVAASPIVLIAGLVQNSLPGGVGGRPSPWPSAGPSSAVGGPFDRDNGGALVCLLHDFSAKLITRSDFDRIAK